MLKEPLDSAAKQRNSASLFFALSEYSRLVLLECLIDGPLTVGALVKLSGLRQANCSKQLGLLGQAGLVQHQRTGKNVYYRLRAPKRLSALLKANSRLLARIHP